MNSITAGDIDYLAQQSSARINLIVSCMTALMKDTDGKIDAMESQNWFQRMVKTVSGKNKMSREEIQKNHDKLNAYMSEAIAELYNRNCLDEQILVSLGTQINELYADHNQLKMMLGAFAKKLNEKIESVDNFHMLTEEITLGTFNEYPRLVAICKILSQYDERILESERKLTILKKNMESQNIISTDAIGIAEWLEQILTISQDDIGQIYMELGCITENFLANIFIRTIENYHFLPDMERKIKKKEVVISEIIQSEGLDDSVGLSLVDIYNDFISSKMTMIKSSVFVEDDETITQCGIEAQNNGDYESGIKSFRIAAGNGYADAQNWLGVAYMRGLGVAKDKKEGFKWFMNAAVQGHARAQKNIGLCYQNGDGIEKNESEAVEWYRKSAEQGDSEGQWRLGLMYYGGYGGAKGCKEAFKWFKKSAEQGNCNGQCWLGNMYNWGKAVAEDKEEAFKWYKKSADQGYAPAQYKLGHMFEKGEGVVEDKAEAEKWYKKSAEQGNTDGQVALGFLYFDHDEAESFKWFMKAAVQGDEDAQAIVGWLYHDGMGVAVDYSESYKWLKKAADQGNEEAIRDLKAWF